ncbi:hypothetical protein D9M69_482800 [compost metagenome]
MLTIPGGRIGSHGVIVEIIVTVTNIEIGLTSRASSPSRTIRARISTGSRGRRSHHRGRTTNRRRRLLLEIVIATLRVVRQFTNVLKQIAKPHGSSSTQISIKLGVIGLGHRGIFDLGADALSRVPLGTTRTSSAVASNGARRVVTERRQNGAVPRRVTSTSERNDRPRNRDTTRGKSTFSNSRTGSTRRRK